MRQREIMKMYNNCHFDVVSILKVCTIHKLDYEYSDVRI